MGEIDKFIAEINPRYSEDGKAAPLWEHKVVYDTNLNTLEPVYYWLVDYLNGVYGGAEKISDTFSASPGSSYFADLGARATRMQEEGMKIMATVNAVVKSIINLIYDLKNFEVRLKQYDKANSKDPGEKEEGILGLKEIWMNSVDAQRGMGSINNMAHQYGFTTLRPAFMAAMSAEQVDSKDFDLNDIVKRVLRPRVGEFFDWVKVSEVEMRKRYDIEKSYLKNQVDTLNLYASWVKPYLTFAEQLRMKEKPNEAALVSVFSQMVLELSLLSKKVLSIEELVISKDLPPEFAKKSKSIRPFYKVLTVEFTFRTYPTPQGAPHAGRLEINFKAYVLNEDELAILNKKRDDKNKDSMLNLAQNLSKESLEKLKDDLNYFLTPKKEEKEETTMFGDLFKDLRKTFVGQTRAEKEEEAKRKKKEDEAEAAQKLKKLWDEGIPEDSHEESVVREYAELESASSCFTAFDIFKKAHGLASFANPFDQPDVYKRIRDRIVEVNSVLKK